MHFIRSFVELGLGRLQKVISEDLSWGWLARILANRNMINKNGIGSRCFADMKISIAYVDK